MVPSLHAGSRWSGRRHQTPRIGVNAPVPKVPGPEGRSPQPELVRRRGGLPRLQCPEHGKEHDDDDHYVGRERVDAVPRVGAGAQRVQRCRPEDRVAGQVHLVPTSTRQVAHEERRDFDGSKQPKADDTERDRGWPPLAREGNEHVGATEAQVVVTDQTGDVDHSERDRQSAEKSVEVE